MTERRSISLLELNQRIRRSLEHEFPELYWITAEISEFQVNLKSGHAYLELVEKEDSGEKIVAKARANIWAGTMRSLKPFFETTTGQTLGPGIKILARVSIEYHELYQLSLNLRDIDPSYTIGDLARQKQLVIRKLQEAGIFEMNRALELPLVPQRIAIVSSSTAAGLGDFMNQLNNNPYGYDFSATLFEAIMQGDQAVESIITALSNIADSRQQFDLVAILRGGGSKLDLNCFDHYDLAFFAAQFPLPLITGIGHDRDESVLDLVAHTRCKTPTAAAEFIINLTADFDQWLDDQKNTAAELGRKHLKEAHETLRRMLMNLPLRVERLMGQKKTSLLSYETRIIQQAGFRLKAEKQKLGFYEKQADMHKPENTLRRGFSITRFQGKAVRSTSELEKNAEIEIQLFDGSISGQINTLHENKRKDKS